VVNHAWSLFRGKEKMRAAEFSGRSQRNLGFVLRSQAQTRPDRIFLMQNERRISFAQSNAHVNRIAVGLRGMGITPGDRVAIFMHSCVEFVFLVLAVNKLGAVWVPVNTDYKGSWLVETINGSKVKILVTDGELLTKISDVRSEISCESLLLVCGDTQTSCEDFTCLKDFDQLPDDEPDLSKIDYGDTAAILWTSGTTGKPKGVLQSHNAWIRTAESGNRNYNTRDDDVVYNCLPMYNSAAWSANIFRALVAGIPCALDRRFSVSNYWDRLRYYGATQTISVGAGHMFLWNLPPTNRDVENPLRTASMVPMPHDIIDPFLQRFGMEALTQGFGQSEIMALLAKVSSPGNPGKAYALGKPEGDLELKLLDDDGNEVAVGEVGEFSVRPLQKHVIFNGYFENPEATKNAFFGEWFRMGDLGKRDQDGDYYFVDRKKDFIRYKGRNISSFEVESIALKHPAVAAAAVFGVTSAELASESEIKLNVILKSETQISAEQLARFINDNAPYFFVPRYIEICTALPYTPTGKIEKYKLREDGVTPETWDRMASGFVLDR
jgi:crotonobetaine/carnitine-CoA ligase